MHGNDYWAAARRQRRRRMRARRGRMYLRIRGARRRMEAVAEFGAIEQWRMPTFDTPGERDEPEIEEAA